MNILRLTPLLLLLGLTGCAGIVRKVLHTKSFESPAGPHEKLTVQMRDGIELSTAYFLPKGDGPFPVVIYRYPYGMEILMDAYCRYWTRYGYACVHQQVRGRGHSGGEWVPFIHERDDGLDTMAWLRGQRWQDGNWALVGESYLAAVHWLMADDLPEEVKTMVLAVFGLDVYDATYADGLMRHELVTAWASMMPDNKDHMNSRARVNKSLETWPPMERDLIFAKTELPWYREWVSSPMPEDAYWQTEVPQKALTLAQSVDIPVFLYGGWADAFLGPQMSTWADLGSREESVMVIGPYSHLGAAVSDLKMPNLKTGQGQYGARQGQPVLEWLNTHLKGEPLATEVGVMHAYVGGADQWVSHHDWADNGPMNTVTQQWVLREPAPNCGGQAAPFTAPAMTEVTPSAPAASDEADARPSSPVYGAGVAQWTHDPLNPVPARGGAGMLAWSVPGYGGPKGGTVDPGPMCERSDVVSFVSEPLTEALHLAGHIEAKLLVETTAPDTAFTLRVAEIRPDGKVIHLRDAFTTLKFNEVRGGQGPVEITLRAWPFEWQVERGSRLRFELASSRFPKVAVHPNTDQPWGEVQTPVSAEQKVHLDRSVILLPTLTALP